MQLSVISHLGLRYAPEKDADLPIPSASLGNLFYEFLWRYEELRNAKRRELFWLVLAVALGLIALLLPWLLPIDKLWPSLVILGIFSWAGQRYLMANASIRHLYVNAQILHHHLVSRIEVGFCRHDDSCNCAEDFRHYVWKKYRISLYNGRFEVNF